MFAHLELIEEIFKILPTDDLRGVGHLFRPSTVDKNRFSSQSFSQISLKVAHRDHLMGLHLNCAQGQSNIFCFMGFFDHYFKTKASQLQLCTVLRTNYYMLVLYN